MTDMTKHDDWKLVDRRPLRAQVQYTRPLVEVFNAIEGAIRIDADLNSLLRHWYFDGKCGGETMAIRLWLMQTHRLRIPYGSVIEQVEHNGCRLATIRDFLTVCIEHQRDGMLANVFKQSTGGITVAGGAIEVNGGTISAAPRFYGFPGVYQISKTSPHVTLVNTVFQTLTGVSNWPGPTAIPIVQDVE